MRRSDTVSESIDRGATQTAEYKPHPGTLGFEGAFCDNQIQTARKSLILNGEMSEWFKEHAWKLIPAARNNSHGHAPTHSPSTTSRNNGVHQSAPVNHSV